MWSLVGSVLLLLYFNFRIIIFPLKVTAAMELSAKIGADHLIPFDLYGSTEKINE